MPSPRRSATEPPRARQRQTLLAGGSAALAVLAFIALALFWVTGTSSGRVPAASPVPAPDLAAEATGDWGALFRDAGRTSSIAAEGPAGALRPRWTFDARSPLFAPVQSGDALYAFAADGILYALDAATGAQRWATDLDSRFPLAIREFAAPAVAGDTVYVGTPRATIVALDAATGRKRWQFTGIGSFVTGVLVDGGLVIGGTSAGMAYGVDAASGELVWSEPVGRISASAPSAGDGIVVIGTNLGAVQALELASGRPLWRIETDRGPIRTMPISAGAVYVPTGDGALLVLDLATGEERWRYDTALTGPVMPPAVSREAGMVVFAVPGVSVFALDLRRGTIEWRAPYPNPDGRTVTIAGSSVYVTRGDGLLVLDARTGNEVGRYDGGSAIGVPLAAGAGVVYGVTAEGGLYALGAADGDPRVNRAVPPTPAPPAGEPTIVVGPAGARPTPAPTPAATVDSPRVE